MCVCACVCACACAPRLTATAPGADAPVSVRACMCMCMCMCVCVCVCAAAHTRLADVLLGLVGALGADVRRRRHVVPAPRGEGRSVPRRRSIRRRARNAHDATAAVAASIFACPCLASLLSPRLRRAHGLAPVRPRFCGAAAEGAAGSGSAGMKARLCPSARLCWFRIRVRAPCLCSFLRFHDVCVRFCGTMLVFVSVACLWRLRMVFVSHLCVRCPCLCWFLWRGGGGPTCGGCPS